MKLKLLAAAVLATAAFTASAADQTFTIQPNVTFDFNGWATPTDGLLSDHSDTISFTGLAAGSYQAVLSYSANFVNITSASLNGQSPTYLIAGSNISLGGFDIMSQSPFTLTLNGTAGASPLASYSGHITVMPVPEPESYAMLLGGLGLMGVIARRKRSAKSKQQQLS